MEIGAQLYTVRDFCKMPDDFADTLPLCHQVTLQEYRARSLPVRLLELVLRVIAPLM